VGSYDEYKWSNNQSTQMITVTAAGVYTVTVTDTNDCTGTASVTVTENANPMPTITGDLAYCSEDGNTTLSVGIYDSYKWSNDATTQMITAIAGDYTVTVTSNDCTGTASVTVIENANPMPTITGDLTYCSEDGSTTLSVATYDSYKWSNDATTQMIAATAGDYIVTVTSNGCIGTASVSVIENASPMPTISGDLTYCADGNTILDAGLYDSYTWSNNAMTQTIEATAGDYTVTVTSNGCTGIASVSVTEDSNITVGILSTFDECVDDGAILDAGSYTNNELYEWSSGQDTQVIQVTTAGIFTVTVTTGSGCSGTATTEIIDICDAFVSGLTHNEETLCAGGEITANVESVQNLDGYDLLYILFSLNDEEETTFVASNDTGTFSSIDAGEYQICAYVELRDCAPNPTPFVGTVNDLDNVGNISEGCYDYVCSNIIMPEALNNAPTATGLATDDNAVGNNIYIVEVCGGVQPYDATNFTSSPPEAFANITGPFTSANPGCKKYRIEYNDEVSWTLVITDSNECSGNEVTFSSDGIPSNPLPEIDNIVTTRVTCAESGGYADNGTLTATISGGDNSCDDYEYSVTSTNGYSQTGTFSSPDDDDTSELFLDNLGTGRYDITITDCDGTTTVGEKHVFRPRRRGRRGCRCRGKVILDTDLLATWQVFPNPFTQQTTMEFTLLESTHITATIYSIEGRLVAEVFNGTVTENTLYQMPVDAHDLPVGVYILQFAMENGDVHYEKLYIKK